MSKKPFSDKRWNDHSLKGVLFDHSHVTPEQEKKTREFHKRLKEMYAKQSEKHDEKNS